MSKPKKAFKFAVSLKDLPLKKRNAVLYRELHLIIEKSDNVGLSPKQIDEYILRLKSIP